MSETKTRVNLSVDKNFVAKLDELANDLLMTRAQTTNMLLKWGFLAYMRAYKPEQVFSSQEWASIITQVSEAGKTIKLPDGTKIGAE